MQSKKSVSPKSKTPEKKPVTPKATDKIIVVSASVLKKESPLKKLEEKIELSKSPSSKVKATTVESKLKQLGLSKEKQSGSITPKKPKTSFTFFSMEQQQSVRKNNKTLSFGDIGKVIGLKWHALTEKEKQPYLNLAELDKVRYEKEST